MMSPSRHLLCTAILLPLLGSLSGCFDQSESSKTDTTTGSDSGSSTDTGTTTSTDTTSTDTTNTGSTGTDTTSSSGTTSSTDTTSSSGSTTTASGSTSAWIINTTERSRKIFESASSQGVLVNVQSVSTVTQDGKDYEQVKATGIPDYQVTVTQDILDTLNSRPKVSTDFVDGKTTVAVGDVVEFGQDIGYKSSTTNCQSTGGYGYWPPGPECPLDKAKQASFPVQPTVITDICNTGLGAIGYMVNGASIYNWNDGRSYNNQNVWHNTAANAEVHDLDICSGHAAVGDYHHHNWSTCQAKQFGDKADGHSPIYGYAADGYPVYGPWFANGVLAKSAWVKRDYASADSASGCGAAGARSCLLNDPYDLSAGTVTTTSVGPTTSATYITQSGNPVSAASGLFYEDYYYDATLTALGGAYLDQNNGHNHGELGYHYHLTIESGSDGKLLPAFPFTFGPRFHGKLESNGLTTCASTATAGLSAAGGRPPGP